MGRWRHIMCTVGVYLVYTVTQAQIPHTLSYQGLLTDTVGTPVGDGSYNITFRLYQASSGGSALWLEARTVQTKRGVFSTNLGEVTPLTLPFDRQYWLSVQIAPGSELTPRMALNASGYSLRALKADTASYSLTAPQQPVADSARVAGTIPNNTVGTAKILDAAVTTAKISSIGASSGQAIMYNGSSVGWGSPGGGGQWTTNGNDIYSSNSGKVGIGTTTPSAKLEADASGSGTSQIGIFGLGSSSDGSDGGGVFAAGYNSSSGRAVGLQGFGSANSGNAYGGYFQSSSNGISYGVYGSSGRYGLYGTVDGSFLNSVYGAYGTATNTAGGTVGGYFKAGTAGNGDRRGVFGVGDIGVYANGDTYSVYGDGGTYAVYAFTGATPGTGVYAKSDYGPGVVSSGYTNGVEATGSTRGVYATGGTYGIVAGASANGGAGVYGSNGGNASTYGGFFENDVRVTRNLVVEGSVFKGGGGFKIDHPTDPANKYLYHSFVESPEMKNIYDGVVAVDAKGEAIVALPDWFGAVNADFRYQLTAIGAPGPNLHIAQKISGNQFKIAGGTPGMEVSWQVTGIRQDAYARAHRIPVEETKPANEMGKFLHPTEEGMPENLGIHYEQMQSMATERKSMEMARGRADADRKKQEEQRSKFEQDRSLQGKQGDRGK